MSNLQKQLLQSLSLPKNLSLFATFPRLKEEKTRSYATFVMTLLAICIFGFFAINPTVGTIIELNKELSDNKFVDQQFVDKIANLATLQTAYAGLQNDIPYVLNAIPEQPNIPTFLAQVQDVAAKTNIDLLRLQVQPVDISNTPQPISSYLSFTFSVDAIGTKSQVDAFILGISSFERLITVDNISISQASQQGSGSETNIRLSLKGRAYFKNQP